MLFTLSLVSLAMVIEVKDEQSPSAGKRRGYVSLSGPGVTIVGPRLCCGVDIIQCLFNLLYDVIS